MFHIAPLTWEIKEKPLRAECNTTVTLVRVPQTRLPELARVRLLLPAGYLRRATETRAGGAYQTQPRPI